MSRIYVRVVVHNESDATLRLGQYSTTGEWTPGGWTPTGQGAPGANVQWQAEGDTVGPIAFTGVEARAWYDVVRADGTVAGQLYVHADSPVVESQYGNTFHVYAPGGFYAAYADRDGQKNADNRSELHIWFRNTQRRAVDGFLPSVNGFQFANHWSDDLPVITLGQLWNTLRDAMGAGLADKLGIGAADPNFAPITHADSGLCGGMTFAVMDYFNARQLPPMPTQNADGKFVPPDKADDPLFLFVRQRLLDSFDFTGRGHRWLSYTSPVYPDDDEGVLQSLGIMKGKAWVTYREEWPAIRALLDRGQLATVGLVQADDMNIGKNHQVLAWAYEQDGQLVRLWIYDPLIPKQEAAPAIADDLYLEFDITNTSDGITVTRHNARDKDAGKHIFAMLYMDAYAPQTPPLGRPIPAPGLPKVLTLRHDSRWTTVDGTVTSQRKNMCGEPVRDGQWTMSTSDTFVAQLANFMEPVTLTWTVDEAAVAADATQAHITRGETVFRPSCHISPGGRSLSLTSAGGDNYTTVVRVEVTDAMGATAHAEADFKAVGDYEGTKVEDRYAEGRCIKRLIPVLVRPGRPERPGPVEGPITQEEIIREQLVRVGQDETLPPNFRQNAQALEQLPTNHPTLDAAISAVRWREV